MIPAVYWEREEADDFVAAYWPNLFAQMLQSCAFDPARWPEPRTRGMFHEWFDVEVCTTVIDLGGDPDRNRY